MIKNLHKVADVIDELLLLESICVFIRAICNLNLWTIAISLNVIVNRGCIWRILTLIIVDIYLLIHFILLRFTTSSWSIILLISKFWDIVLLWKLICHGVVIQLIKIRLFFLRQILIRHHLIHFSEFLSGDLWIRYKLFSFLISWHSWKSNLFLW